MIVVDASVIYALLDAGDSWHERASAWYRATTPALATTPLVVAEVDHLAGARAGREARDAWRADLVAGAYHVVWWAGAETEIVEVASAYHDLGIDLTDASLVALAGRLGTLDLATIDERHFRAVVSLSSGAAFRLLPADG